MLFGCSSRVGIFLSPPVNVSPLATAYVFAILMRALFDTFIGHDRRVMATTQGRRQNNDPNTTPFTRAVAPWSLSRQQVAAAVLARVRGASTVATHADIMALKARLQLFGEYAGWRLASL